MKNYKNNLGNSSVKRNAKKFNNNNLNDDIMIAYELMRESAIESIKRIETVIEYIEKINNLIEEMKEKIKDEDIYSI